MSKIEDLYLIRYSKSHYYFKGSGNFAVPKLYKLSDAKRVVALEKKKPFYKVNETDGELEIVPVTLILKDLE